jgi:hypothetical protein
MQLGTSRNQSSLQVAVVVQAYNVIEIAQMLPGDEQDGHGRRARQTINEWRQHLAVICERDYATKHQQLISNKRRMHARLGLPRSSRKMNTGWGERFRDSKICTSCFVVGWRTCCKLEMGAQGAFIQSGYEIQQGKQE